MSLVRAFVGFWWHFLVGDDWTIAAGVIVAIAATWGLLQTSVAAWWLLPLVCVAILTLSVRRASRRG
jgi:hypothetical protein